MNINDLNVVFPKNSQVLLRHEEIIELSIRQDKNYRGFLKLLDSFLFLFSDDVKSSFALQLDRDPLILLYSEAFKRIRSSSIIALKGYYIDAVCILRSVYELNKGINAIQNSVISSSEYFGKERDSEFLNLPDSKKEQLIEKHSRNIDNKVNEYDSKDLPSDIRPLVSQR